MGIDLIVFLMFLGLIGFLVVTFIVIAKVTDWHFKFKAKQFAEKYPEYVAMWKEINKKEYSNCNYHAENIFPLKTKIDELTKKITYLPKEEREKVEVEIEETKKLLFKNQLIYSEKEIEIRADYSKFQEYKKNHGIGKEYWED